MRYLPKPESMFLVPVLEPTLQLSTDPHPYTYLVGLQLEQEFKLEEKPEVEQGYEYKRQWVYR